MSSTPLPMANNKRHSLLLAGSLKRASPRRFGDKLTNSPRMQLPRSATSKRRALRAPSRLPAASAASTACAIEVRVARVDATRTSTGAPMAVRYLLEVRSSTHRWCQRKRYSELRNLHTKLALLEPNQAVLRAQPKFPPARAPQTPAKGSRSRGAPAAAESPGLLEERRAALDAYMGALLRARGADLLSPGGSALIDEFLASGGTDKQALEEEEEEEEEPTLSPAPLQTQELGPSPQQRLPLPASQKQNLEQEQPLQQQEMEKAVQVQPAAAVHIAKAPKPVPAARKTQRCKQLMKARTRRRMVIKHSPDSSQDSSPAPPALGRRNGGDRDNDEQRWLEPRRHQRNRRRSAEGAAAPIIAPTEAPKKAPVAAGPKPEDADAAAPANASVRLEFEQGAGETGDVCAEQKSFEQGAAAEGGVSESCTARGGAVPQEVVAAETAVREGFTAADTAASTSSLECAQEAPAVESGEHSEAVAASAEGNLFMVMQNQLAMCKQPHSSHGLATCSLCKESIPCTDEGIRNHGDSCAVVLGRTYNMAFVEGAVCKMPATEAKRLQLTTTCKGCGLDLPFDPDVMERHSEECCSLLTEEAPVPQHCADNGAAVAKMRCGESSMVEIALSPIRGGGEHSFSFVGNDESIEL